MANIDVFTNKYRTTLTVKNELKPIGATLDYIKKHGGSLFGGNKSPNGFAFY